ncbi:hypothetical protein AnigIFM63604_003089 [Aspergillus niger]|uniref:AAA+ ATPase domain-containing protein n=1 Tax=Aspergillus niger TaxID=5061 RepID=A0A9W6EG86_ASPNG|nr:hypothetical protein AnigIFM63604_003089 [Aspergillus niger]
MDPKIKANLISDLAKYLNPAMKKYCGERGIPYRRGYLFHGPPGTGKSSLCHTLASVACLDIYTVSLSSKAMTGDLLHRLFASLPSHCIVIFEDVDQAGVENRSASSTSIQCKAASDDDETKCLDLPKRTESAEGGITLSDLLNVIDGISAREGRILIMTTNKPEDLDEALKRPGRVDLQIRFDFVNTHAAKELFLIPYVECPTEDFIVDPETMEIRCSLKPVIKDLTPERLAGLAESFARKITVGKYSSAQLQGYLMRFKGDPVSAERHVEDWMQRMDTEKAGDMLPSFSSC